jgi:hypothetical protein
MSLSIGEALKIKETNKVKRINVSPRGMTSGTFRQNLQQKPV